GQPSWGTGQTLQVLVPLDGSELSAAILPVVERLAGPLELSIHLLHAIEPLPASAAGPSARLEEVHALREREAEGYLDKVARAIEPEGLPVRRVVRVGPAVEVIQRYAQEAAIDLIAMTTHGRTGLSRLLFGSVAEQVLRAVAIPLVLWKQREG
ncbi:MAG: universal stress protein, partial [Candidatus Rokubacteria bacterium]|nr:universal stress protein [Candidatus Rokubacteria bacterium]